jgi:hypothetical protein
MKLKLEWHQDDVKLQEGRSMQTAAALGAGTIGADSDNFFEAMDLWVRRPQS